MFGHLKDPQTDAYDLVVFDEAHKLSADRQPDFGVRKTDRYKLAEALAVPRWTVSAGCFPGRPNTCCC